MEDRWAEFLFLSTALCGTQPIVHQHHGGLQCAAQNLTGANTSQVIGNSNRSPLWLLLEQMTSSTCLEECFSSIGASKVLLHSISLGGLRVSFCEDWSYGLTQGTGPRVLLCTFCWDIRKCVLVWAGPRTWTKSLKKCLVLLLFLKLFLVSLKAQ